ncbi:hypothetical protein MP228_000683 [Amoeboaphelidium protococcarum]|nr:hypothetical protein MP228_000683 [Amoeboaphelidium protococcarum]
MKELVVLQVSKAVVLLGSICKLPQLYAARNSKVNIGIIVVETSHLLLSLWFCSHLNSLSIWLYGELYPLIAFNIISLCMSCIKSDKINVLSAIVVYFSILYYALNRYAADILVSKSILCLSNLTLLPLMTLLSARNLVKSNDRIQPWDVIFSIVGVLMASGRVLTAFMEPLKSSQTITNVFTVVGHFVDYALVGKSSFIADYVHLDSLQSSQNQWLQKLTHADIILTSASLYGFLFSITTAVIMLCKSITQPRSVTSKIQVKQAAASATNLKSKKIK